MKKIFTLIAMAAMAIGANAQVWKVNADTPTAENSTWLDDDMVTVKTTFAGTVKESAATIAGEEFTHYAQVRVDAAPTAAVPQGTDKGGSTSLIITPKKDVTYTIYYRRQAGDWTSNDGKDVKVIDQADAGTVLEAEMTIDSKTEDGNYGLATKVISLKAGKTYTVWARGTTLNYYGMKFEAAGGEQGGGQGQGGGEQPTGDVEEYVATPNGKLAAEFAAAIDESNVATNVENGSSIIKFGTTNVTVEAVGSADPADKPEGGQDITIGALIDDAEHTYELVSINSTKPIKWELKNQGDISYYYVAGTGTPAVSMVAEEVYTEGVATGNYRVKVTAFDPAVGGEPQSGLYYKFTTAVDGALKVGIWANKGSRTTFLVDGDTKQPSEYLVEGYINGQNAVDEFGESTGQKKWLTNDEIRALGSADKPWVIGAGNQPFWGNVIIDAKAGKTYWLFQGNSQIGFQGYTFAPGKTKEQMVTDPTGIKDIIAGKTAVNARIYNLQGQVVGDDYKGIVIKNGKKFLKK